MANNSKREELKLRLIDQTHRKVLGEDERWHRCEGQAYIPHTCQGGFEMNEVIFTRGHIRHLSKSEKKYFWHEINCSIVCTWFHPQHGESRDFRDKYVNRMIEIFGRHNVAYFIHNAPLRTTEYAWVYSPFVDEKPIEVKRDSDRRVIAKIIGDTLIKKCKSIHMLLKPAGWAYDVTVLETAKANNVKYIEIENTDTHQVYKTTLETFIARGIPIDRGYSKQIVLPIEYWETDFTGQTTLFDLLEEKE